MHEFIDFTAAVTVTLLPALVFFPSSSSSSSASSSSYVGWVRVVADFLSTKSVRFRLRVFVRVPSWNGLLELVPLCCAVFVFSCCLSALGLVVAIARCSSLFVLHVCACMFPFLSWGSFSEFTVRGRGRVATLPFCVTPGVVLQRSC
mmetsp:Transcript_7067/g.10388  ORF Transcript_7067/g.10388 Transcript_7067/m.10388 type:complete len:147 (-) Transcript_7067:22-462(-)